MEVVSGRGLARRLPDATYVRAPYLGEWLRILGVNKRKLARQVGTSPQCISHWATPGWYRMHGRNLNRIGDAVGVPSMMLVYCRPWDDDALPWARQAALAISAEKESARDEGDPAPMPPTAA